MARKARVQFEGAVYHILDRGDQRERIFADEEDRERFLKTLGEVCERTGWRVHAWVLMDNHCHLMVETPEPNLVTGMGWVQNAYTRRFNTRHRYWGRLSGDRYKAILVDARTGYYYCTLLDYIHLNPVRVGLVNIHEGKGLLEYPWSSLASGYALPEPKRAPWLAVKEGLSAYGYPDSTAGRRKYVEHLERRVREEESQRCGVPELPEDGRLSHLRKGWYWGTQAFADQMRKLLDKPLRKVRAREYRSSEMAKEHDMRQAEEMLSRALEKNRLGMEELARLPGSDPRKVKIASQIRSKTTVSMGWIAEHLGMSSAANASQQIRRFKIEQESRKKRKRKGSGAVSRAKSKNRCAKPVRPVKK